MQPSVFALAGLLAAGSASAMAAPVSDVDYLRASRCKGLAQSLPGVVDATALAAYLKDGGARLPYISERADEEFRRGKRDGAKTELKARYTAELNTACTAYVTPSSTAASSSSPGVVRR